MTEQKPSRRWRWIAVATAGVAIAALGVGVSFAATSVPAAVHFVKIRYDSPGKDTGTNASLNGEYFQVANGTKATINLTGWTVRDKANHVYKLTGTLAAGKFLVVHTGRGTAKKPHSYDRYWGSKAYIWNNTGDTAILRDKAGKTMHSCKWTKLGGAVTCGKPVVPKPAPTPPRTTLPTTAPTIVPTNDPTGDGGGVIG